MEPKVNIDVTINELNTILAGLGRLPYEAVFTLIDAIKLQANEQLAKQQAQQNVPEGALKSKVLPN